MHAFQTKKYFFIHFVLILTVMSLTGCKSPTMEPAKNSLDKPYDQIETINRGNPDDRGIITYDTYQVLIANGNETISQIAIRLGINEEKLALYNGLISNYRPRANELIALPEDQFISSSGWSTEITSATINKIEDNDPKISSANNPLRHRVQEGETIYSLAREYKVSVSAIATWNGLGPDLDIKTGREIIIPAAAIEEEFQEPEIASQKNLVTNKEKTIELETESLVKPKDQSAENKSLPTEPQIISIKPFIAPVNGSIVSKYSQDKGSQNNNGIDYETEINSPVKAVADGTVVLISDIVGGNGKIVLIRHENELITIYGRLSNILFEKGTSVLQGQPIGSVIKDSKTKKGLMHFEVRRGMKSIDPETMIR